MGLIAGRNRLRMAIEEGNKERIDSILQRYPTLRKEFKLEEPKEDKSKKAK